MPINLEYEDCPDCGEPIDDDKEAGDSCECGYVFAEPSPSWTVPSP